MTRDPTIEDATRIVNFVAAQRQRPIEHTAQGIKPGAYIDQATLEALLHFNYKIEVPDGE
jgi:hypothetical protein